MRFRVPAVTDTLTAMSSYIIPAVILVVLVVYLVFWFRRSNAQKAQDAADGVVVVLPTSTGYLRLTASSLIEGYAPNTTVHPLDGVKSSVEDSGTVNRRFTVTRMATLGVAAFALPKKLDDRELYLTIEGPSTVIVRSVALKKNPSAAVAAREFSARINQTAAALGG